MTRKSHQDSAVRFVTAKSWPERATETRQYDLLRPNVCQKKPPRLGSTICYGQTWARKSQQDSAVRFVMAKCGPERATKTRQYDLLRPNVGQKEPPRLGNTICFGQTWARKSHRDSAVRFVTAEPGSERATKTRQYDLLRPNVGQKEPPRLGSTICYGQELARKSHQDSAVRFVTAKSWPERATETRQYDLLRPRVGQKEPPRLGSTICYGQTWARKSHQDSAVRFGQKEPPRLGSTIWPERATKTRPYNLLRPNVGQKEPPRLGSTICYGQDLARKNHQDSAVRLVTAKHGPERVIKTRQYDLISAKSWPEKVTDSAVRFVPAKSCPERATKTRQYDLISAKSWPERATKTRQYDLLRPAVDQKEPPYDLSQPKVGKKEAIKTRPYDLLRPRVGQKKPPRLGCRICYGQTWARKSQQDSAVRFVMAKCGPERATKTRQYDLLRPNVGQKEPPRLGSTICYGQDLARKIGSTICSGQTWARKSHQDSAVRFVTAKSWPEKATKTRQYVLLRPRVGQKEPPRLGSTMCYGQTWARKSHQDSAVRFVTAKRGPERATETRQDDLLRQTWASKSHRDSAVRFVTAKSWPE